MKDYRILKPRFLVAAILLLACIAAFLGAAWRARALLNAALDGRRERPLARAQTTEFTLLAEMRKEQAMTRVGGWLSVVYPERTTIRTQRGMLYAEVYTPIGGETDGAPWALVVHGGLGTSGAQMQDVACELSLAGYNVLLPDLYGHGQSDGDVSTLGLADAQDVRACVDWILGREPNAQIALIGQDEGAVAVLLAAGEGLAGAVKIAVLDSVYLNAKERVAGLLAETGAGGAVDEMLLDVALRTALGIDLSDVNILESAAKSEIPLLFIHGTLDSEAPAYHSEDAAAAANGGELLLVEGAAHGMARYVNPDAYYGAVLTLLEKNIDNAE